MFVRFILRDLDYRVINEYLPRLWALLRSTLRAQFGRTAMREEAQFKQSSAQVVLALGNGLCYEC